MLVVQKYGGSSLATPKHIQGAARKIAELKKSGASVVVVASAMGHMTDHLLKLAGKTVKVPPSREVDMLLTAGERISMSLLSMALQELGVPAISFTGSQSGIITTNDHTDAKIIDVRPNRICEELALGKVVIIAGFQGVSEKKEITTLGRGGSDTTAVALAAVLKADRCEILTDVEGLYSADPRIVPQAKILTQVDYDAALEMASLGAKMQARSIELAKKFDVKVRIASSQVETDKGTQVSSQSKDTANFIEQLRVSGVATKDGFCFFKAQTTMLKALSVLKHISFPLRFASHSQAEFSFLCEKEKTSSVRELLKKENIKFEEVANVATVSVVGEGIAHSLGFFEKTVSFMDQSKMDCLIVVSNSVSITWAVESRFKTQLANFLHK